MSPVDFQRATRQKAKARIALAGPSGSGKTFTALAIAQGLANSMENVFLIDTENSSASYYADDYAGFVHGNLTDFSARAYTEAVESAIAGGAEVIILDSISPAWDEILRMVDDAQARNKGNKWAAWRDASPEHDKLINLIQRCPAHVIATMRVKTAWEIQEVDGKKKPVKIGLTPKQREGMEYEFDMLFEIDLDHTLVVSKSRIRDLADKVYRGPDAELGKTIRAWMDQGEDAPKQGMTAEEVGKGIEEKLDGVKLPTIEQTRKIEGLIEDLAGLDPDTDYNEKINEAGWHESAENAEKVIKRLEATVKKKKNA